MKPRSFDSLLVMFYYFILVHRFVAWENKTKQDGFMDDDCDLQ